MITVLAPHSIPSGRPAVGTRSTITPTTSNVSLPPLRTCLIEDITTSEHARQTYASSAHLPRSLLLFSGFRHCPRATAAPTPVSGVRRSWAVQVHLVSEQNITSHRFCRAGRLAPMLDGASKHVQSRRVAMCVRRCSPYEVNCDAYTASYVGTCDGEHVTRSPPRCFVL